MTRDRFMEKMELKCKENEWHVQHRIALFNKAEYERNNEDLSTDEFKQLRRKVAEAWLEVTKVRTQLAQLEETSAKIDYLELV